MRNKLVLKASAGTGKTFRLSLEYILALLRGTNYREILVMTFTRKATAEIKKEVLEKISNFVDIYNLALNKEINAVEYTLKDLVNESSLEVDMKEKYINLLVAIEKIMNTELQRKDLEKLPLIYEEILKNKEKIKIYTIDSFLNILFGSIVINFWGIKNYVFIDEEENIYYYKKVLEQIFKDKKLFSEFKDFFVDNSQKNIDNYLDTIKILINDRWKYLISASNFESKDKFKVDRASYEYLKEIFSYIEENCQKELESSLKKDYTLFINKSDEELINLLEKNYKIIFSNSPYNGNKFKKSTDAEHKENMDYMYENLKNILSRELYNKVLLPYDRKIAKLNEKIYRIYDNLKIRDKKFTFNDVALYVYMTILNPENDLLDEKGLKENFYENLDMNIDTIFIDEFQDTSILQWKILFELIKQAKSVICVGDEKQSIYGWRGGEKKLFENLEKIINGYSLSLDTSYRSDIAIVESTNKLFQKISMDEAEWRFENSKVHSKDKGYIKCIYLKKDKISENNQDIYNRLVEELINTKLKNYSDIAIIARKNDELEKIAAILEEHKIPYSLSKKRETKSISGIFEYLELLNYLLYDKDLSFFNFLASDLSDFGTEEIELLLKNKTKTLNFINDLLDNLTYEDFKNKMSEKILNFLTKIKHIKRDYKKYSPQELTYKIYENFDFYNYFSKDNDLKNLAELYLFSKKYLSILDFYSALINNEIKFSESKLDKNAIELMTIHKSKGLQFKTVFVVNSLKQNRKNDLDFIFSMDNNYDKVKFSLFLKKGYDRILDYCLEEEIKNIKQREKEEEINNFYVAVTRAKNNLFIITEDEKYLRHLKDNYMEENLKEIKEDIFENGELKYFKTEENSITNNEKTYSLKLEKENLDLKLNENFDVNSGKFILQTEEKRMLGIVIHYFLENIKRGKLEEIDYAIKLCYKEYVSYFGEEKMKKIFSKENINKILDVAGDIFSNKWQHIYSEYPIYDDENNKSYRIDRLMIKDKTNSSEKGEIYIVDYKTGAKNDEQLENYKNLVSKKLGDDSENYSIRTKFLEFNIKY